MSDDFPKTEFTPRETVEVVPPPRGVSTPHKLNQPLAPQNNSGEERIRELREILQSFTSPPKIIEGNATLTQVVDTEPVQNPSKLEIALRGYWWRFLSSIPFTAADGVREQIRWAIAIDHTHQEINSEPFMQKPLLQLTTESRKSVDDIVLAKLGRETEPGETVTVLTTAKDDDKEEVFVAIQRVSEEKGPAYVAYEISKNKVSGEAVVLSHGAIDTDLTDVSNLPQSLKTNCSWKKEGFNSDQHPRAAGVIFNALTQYVLAEKFKNDPGKVQVFSTKESAPQS